MSREKHSWRLNFGTVLREGKSNREKNRICHLRRGTFSFRNYYIKSNAIGRMFLIHLNDALSTIAAYIKIDRTQI